MATQYAKAQYMEVVDMQTKNGKTTVIGIHTPQGATPYMKLKGFFTQFRKYRYKGIKALHVRPASGLPIDPLGLTVQIGSSDQMNPQDTFNPILFKGCHGEHMRAVLDKFLTNSEYVSDQGTNLLQSGDDGDVSGSLRSEDFDNIMDSQYYKCLTDVSWKKFGVQSGFTLRNLHPLVWKMARNTPLNPSAGGYGATVYETNAGLSKKLSGSQVVSPATTDSALGSEYYTEEVASVPTVAGANEYVQEFTNGCARLGWLPTTCYVQGKALPQISALPKLFMGMLILPPSYSCEQYMRAVLVHEFEFKEFSSSVAGMDDGVNYPVGPSINAQNAYWNWIDYQTSKGNSVDVLNGDVEMRSDGVA